MSNLGKLQQKINEMQKELELQAVETVLEFIADEMDLYEAIRWVSRSAGLKYTELQDLYQDYIA